MKKGVLHHIEFYVSDLKQSIDFWGWLLTELGYEIYQKWENGRSWKLDSTYIVFVQVQKQFATIPYHRKQVGMNHLAFYASSRAHVDELTTLLSQKDVPILYADAHPYAGGPNHYAIYFEDPDRIKVEIVAP
ncbi:VOC family protein [Marinilactibacillus kalidii]|uniref:VOC family protein n=1 Tax=Marinilactibacillus kalidii TaxID=2820274 RepID=UPI001ABEC070|nr:VOC family protein [Marinilactibacillus kalidii]